MSMHLEGPWLSMTGKRRGKVKFRNADQARQARELAAEWEQNQARWKAMSKPINTKKQTTQPTSSSGYNSRTVNESRPKSLNSWVTGACTVKATPKYTGDKILGIGTMHKSNAVPIFSDQEAVDISKMRRG